MMDLFCRWLNPIGSFYRPIIDPTSQKSSILTCALNIFESVEKKVYQAEKVISDCSEWNNHIPKFDDQEWTDEEEKLYLKITCIVWTAIPAAFALYYKFPSLRPFFNIITLTTTIAYAVIKAPNWLLSYASKNGYEKLARTMLVLRADVNRHDFSENLTPLHHAAKNGHAQMIKFLIDHGAKFTLGGGWGCTGALNNPPIHYAIWNNRAEAVLELIKNEQRLSTTYLKDAIIAGHPQVVKTLLDSGKLQVDIKIDGITPLFLACQFQKKEIVRLLLEDYKADVSISSEDEQEWKNGLLPLHVAANNPNMEIIELLVKHGCDIASKTPHGYTLLHLVCKKGNTSLLQVLLPYIQNNIFSIESVDNKKNNVLHLAHGKADILNILLTKTDAKNLINEVNAEGETVLHECALNGTLKGLKLLIEHGAQVNMTVKNGQIPLHAACRRGWTRTSPTFESRLKIITTLIHHEANVNAVDHLGRTPLHFAMTTSDSLIQVLKSNVDCRDNKGRTPAHISAIYGNCSWSSCGSDSSKDDEGKTPLDYYRMSQDIRKKYRYPDLTRGVV